MAESGPPVRPPQNAGSPPSSPLPTHGIAKRFRDVGTFTMQPFAFGRWWPGQALCHRALVQPGQRRCGLPGGEATRHRDDAPMRRCADAPKTEAGPAVGGNPRQTPKNKAGGIRGWRSRSGCATCWLVTSRRCPSFSWLGPVSRERDADPGLVDSPVAGQRTRGRLDGQRRDSGHVLRSRRAIVLTWSHENGRERIPFPVRSIHLPNDNLAPMPGRAATTALPVRQRGEKPSVRANGRQYHEDGVSPRSAGGRHVVVPACQVLGYRCSDARRLMADARFGGENTG